MVLVQLPSEYLKSKSPLPTLSQLSEMATLHNDIKDNPAKRKEASKLAWDLKNWLDLYATWEQKFLVSPVEEEAQAA
jgi:hypothetical protein